MYVYTAENLSRKTALRTLTSKSIRLLEIASFPWYLGVNTIKYLYPHSAIPVTLERCTPKHFEI